MDDIKSDLKNQRNELNGLSLKLVSVEELVKKAIRKGTLAAEFFPVMCGSALSNTGVKLALDAVIDYLPSPEEVQKIIDNLCDKPIVLNIVSPLCPDLTVIDLPGITRIPVGN